MSVKPAAAQISDEDILVEPKGVDAFPMKKHFRLIMASNDDHVVRAEIDDRRYFVLNVDAGARNQDKDYFGRLRDEWRCGGGAALFRHLTGAWYRKNVGNGEFRNWDRPATKALGEQKNLSLPPAQLAIQNMLREGEVPCDFIWRPRTNTATGARETYVFVPTQGLHDAVGLRGDELKGLSEGLHVVAQEVSTRATVNGRQVRGFWLPPLPQCRSRWAAWLRRPIDWPDYVTDWGCKQAPY